jgi:hypothetical protein
LKNLLSVHLLRQGEPALVVVAPELALGALTISESQEPKANEEQGHIKESELHLFGLLCHEPQLAEAVQPGKGPLHNPKKPDGEWRANGLI